MTQRRLSNWLQSYLEYAQFTEAPEEFHFCTGISTIASVLRRKVWIDQKYFTWLPNFYILLVAPAGIATKTTSIELGLGLLEQVDGIHIGPDAVTWQQMIHLLAEHKDLVKVPGGPGNVIDDDFHPMCCMSFFIGELGTMFKPDNNDMVDALTSLWDGKKGRWWKSTKTAGEAKIENPWVHIIGGTTPAWMERNFPEYLVGGGLTSRIIFVYAEEKRQYIPYPADLIIDADFDKQKEDLIHDLRLMANLYGTFTLTPQAKEWGSAWYIKHWKDKRPIHLISSRYGGYISRKQTHIHKLAMVLSAAKRDDLVIGLDELMDAAVFITKLEKDMNKVFSSIGVSDTAKNITEMQSMVNGSGKIEKIELFKHCIKIMKHSEFEEAFQAAIVAGYIRMSSDGKKQWVYPITQKEGE